MLSAIRPSIRAFLEGDEDQHEESVSALRDFIFRMKENELHYIKKENILFLKIIGNTTKNIRPKFFQTFPKIIVK